MVVTNIKTVRPFIWIPPDTEAQIKITIERNDGTIDDITDIISFAKFEDNVTESIGNFEIEFWNPNDDYTNVYTGNEIVRYYKDYAATATTLRFRGRIEKPSNKENKINVKGRSEALKMMDVTVTKSYDNIETSVIVKELFNTYLTNFTTNNVYTSTETITVNWVQKPLFDCMKELATAAGFNFYISADLEVYYYEIGSIDNNTEAIVHNMNLLYTSNFVPDLTLVKNRIIVYGAITDGVQVLATAEDSNSQTKYGIKEMIINDDNITTETNAQEVADYEKARRKDPPLIGEITGWLLASLIPGERLKLSDPDNNVDPGWYNTTGYKDEINNNTGMRKTTVSINKELRTISHVLKNRIEQENKKKNTTLNPEEMRYSYNFLFNSDSGTHSDTEITDGLLKPTAATGTWISANRTLNSNLLEAYVIINGQFLDDITISVSGNNGTSYQSFTSNKTKLVLSNAIGPNIRVKVDFTSADARIDSLSILYKIE